MSNSTICSRCGAALQPSSMFCPNCGQRVSDAAPMYPPTQKMPEADLPQPNSYAASLPDSPAGGGYGGAAYNPPYVDEAPRPKSRLPLIIGGVLLFICLCGTAAVVGGMLLLGSSLTDVAALLASPTPTATNTPQPSATPAPSPTPLPTATQPVLDPPTQEPVGFPTPADPAEWDENPFADDFSSDRGWASQDGSEDPSYMVGWMGDYYSIEVRENNTRVWVFPPTSYNPTSLEFDAQIPTDFNGEHGGTFGAMCYFEDGDNYVAIAADPFNDAYGIFQIDNNESSSLLSDNWLTFNEFAEGAGAVNHLLVTCQNGTVDLYINDLYVTSVDVPNAPADGQMGLTVRTYEDIDPGGFAIWFDNVNAWIPQQ
ncbi:MAG: zinc-ribbon domain-containing protein [Chloroflexota bacterium]